MTKVYILQVQGSGDDEDAFENIGVFSDEQKLEAAKIAFLEKYGSDDESDEPVFGVEEFVLNTSPGFAMHGSVSASWGK